MAFRLLFLTLLFPVWTITGHASAQHIRETVIVLDTRNIEVKIPNGALMSAKLIGQVRPEDNSQSNEPPARGNRVFIEESKRKKVLIGTGSYSSVVKNIPVATVPP